MTQRIPPTLENDMATFVQMGQAKHMGKWEAATAMVRLVEQMKAGLEENGLLNGRENDEVNNVLCTFLATLPQKVRDEVREG